MTVTVCGQCLAQGAFVRVPEHCAEITEIVAGVTWTTTVCPAGHPVLSRADEAQLELGLPGPTRGLG